MSTSLDAFFNSDSGLIFAQTNSREIANDPIAPETLQRASWSRLPHLIRGDLVLAYRQRTSKEPKAIWSQRNFGRSLEEHRANERLYAICTDKEIAEVFVARLRIDQNQVDRAVELIRYTIAASGDLPYEHKATNRLVIGREPDFELYHTNMRLLIEHFNYPVHRGDLYDFNKQRWDEISERIIATYEARQKSDNNAHNQVHVTTTTTGDRT